MLQNISAFIETELQFVDGCLVKSNYDYRFKFFANEIIFGRM